MGVCKHITQSYTSTIQAFPKPGQKGYLFNPWGRLHTLMVAWGESY